MKVVTVHFRKGMYYLEFSQLPGKQFGPFDRTEAIRDLTVSALLNAVDARTLVFDATTYGTSQRSVEE